MPASQETHSKRDEILEVASRLFYEQGFHCTGIQQIIQESKVAKGTFYGHFKSKEALGLAWLKQRHETWMAWLENSLAKHSDAKSKILGVFEFLSEWMAQADYRGCAFLNTLCETPNPSNPLREEVERHKQGLLDRFMTLVQAHHNNQKPEQCEHLAKLFFILFEGALIQMQNFRSQWPLENAISEVKKQL